MLSFGPQLGQALCRPRFHVQNEIFPHSQQDGFHNNVQFPPGIIAFHELIHNGVNSLARQTTLQFPFWDGLRLKAKDHSTGPAFWREKLPNWCVWGTQFEIPPGTPPPTVFQNVSSVAVRELVGRALCLGNDALKGLIVLFA
eukprot:INCI6360.1.p1 GENE.INCI6360.1~~INCI6360.1.p1  ORF type:complete len:142 (+),score=13.57 INCI6360.1:31-456(+)